MPITTKKAKPTTSSQIPLHGLEHKEKGGNGFSDPAFAVNKQAPMHRWVPWIAGFSRSFVQDALERYLGNNHGTVLDPFSGVGTTLVEAMVHGHNAIGFEINPYAAFACKVKTNARFVDTNSLSRTIADYTGFSTQAEQTSYRPITQPPVNFKSRAPFYSPSVERKVLATLDFIGNIENEREADLFKLAFASTMVRYSNYSYEPSLGRRVSAGKEEIHDFPVYETIRAKLEEMCEDIAWFERSIGSTHIESQVINQSFFEATVHLKPQIVDLVITSPPYLNNYHYNRNTRPQLFWLELVKSPKDLQPLEEMNFGKFWQTVREEDRISLSFDLPGSDLPDLVNYLRTLNAAKGIYGGNGWANYAASYFNDCYRFAVGLRHSLKAGGIALVVVGNSVVQGVDIAVDKYLGEIAQLVGLRLVDIHVPRSKRVGDSIVNSGLRTATQKSRPKLYEAVVELQRL